MTLTRVCSKIFECLTVINNQKKCGTRSFDSWFLVFLIYSAIFSVRTSPSRPTHTNFGLQHAHDFVEIRMVDHNFHLHQHDIDRIAEERQVFLLFA